jgi:polar amino acid transport system substrate-binding protein
LTFCYDRAVRFLTALFLLYLAGSATAAELLAVGARFERVYEQRADGEFTGMAPELLRTLAERMGHTVRFAVYPWARAQAMVAEGKADILIGPYKTPEREQLMAFSKRAFYRDRMVFYARNEAHLQWNGEYDKLAGLRILAINGWAYGPQFEAARPRLQIQTVNTLESALSMLAAGRADLLATNRRNAEPEAERLRLADRVAPLPTVIEVQDGYFAFPLKERVPHLRADFDTAFAAYADAGELHRLAQRLHVTAP